MGFNKFQHVTTLLFDLDNTLINTKDADRIACEQVFQYLMTCGFRCSAARKAVDEFYASIRETRHSPSNEDSDPNECCLILWKQALGPGSSSRAGAANSLWKETRNKHLKLSSELEDLLLELRKHYKLGLITNGPSFCQWEKIRRLNGQALFDAIVVSGDLKLAKPSAAIFEEAFRRLDSASMECVMVGNHLETDIKGAIKANCAASVWINSDQKDLAVDEDCPKPDFRISHLREIVDLLPQKKGFSFLSQEKALGFFHSLRDEVWKFR